MTFVNNLPQNWVVLRNSINYMQSLSYLIIIIIIIIIYYYYYYIIIIIIIIGMNGLDKDIGLWVAPEDVK